MDWNLELCYFSNVGQNSETLELWNFAGKTNFKLLAWNLELGTLVLGKPECFSNVGQNSGTLELWNLAGKANFKLLAWNLELGTLVLGKLNYFSNVGPEL